jgi:hypothetical protein
LASGAGLANPRAVFDSATPEDKYVLRQQTVSTALGQLTVSSLTLGELRQLDSLFQDSSKNSARGVTSLLKYLPVIFGAVRKVHQDLTLDQLEDGLTLDDFNTLFSAVLEVSGLKKAAPGEPIPVPV